MAIPRLDTTDVENIKDINGVKRLLKDMISEYNFVITHLTFEENFEEADNGVIPR